MRFSREISHAWSCEKRSALVLVTVLWVFVLMAIVAAGINLTSRLDTKVAMSGVEGKQKLWACKGGLQMAMAVLIEDERDIDGFSDLWYENEEDFNDLEIGEYLCSVVVTDEACKLNINSATRNQLAALPNMTEEIADAIIDWRDKDDNASPGGAEDGYYLGLSFGYKCANAPFRTVRELLLVKDIDEAILYGEDYNLNGQLDTNERDGEKSVPYDNEDDVLDEGLFKYVTCYSYEDNKDSSGGDRVNINSADESTLTQKLGIDSGQAKWIIEHRKYNGIGDLISSGSPKNKQPGGANNDQAVAMDLETFKSIIDKITIADGKIVYGKVNVNTAEREVLEALFEGGSQAESIAASIITAREQQVEGIPDIGSLLDVDSMKVDDFKKIVDHVTVRSRVFRIICNAEKISQGYRASKLSCEAVVDRAEEDCRVLYWYQGASN